MSFITHSFASIIHHISFSEGVRIVTKVASLQFVLIGFCNDEEVWRRHNQGGSSSINPENKDWTVLTL